ncbi:MAG TPA: hypothetical protein VNZ49_14205 [Bacteroidia bacterium]|jgi:hypothetical protein|nr:hypothetical protein [Bacteroidia bacterium]
MKTKIHVLKTVKDTSTTSIISIPPCAASGILKSLNENKISCDYMGLDQSGRILMQIRYEANHDELIKELNTYMEQFEELLHEVTKAVKETIQKRNDEINKEIDEILNRNKKKREERTKTSATI